MNSPAPRRSKCSIPGAAAGMILAFLVKATSPAAAALTFEAPYRAYDTGPSCYDLAVGDLNGDGHPDVGTANTGSASVTLYLTGPNGAFNTRADLSMSSLPNSSIAFGDINGDGLIDLLATKGGSAGGIYYRLSLGSGNFSDIHVVLDANRPVAVRVADLNNDGMADLVAPANESTHPAYLGFLDSWLGQGGGAFGTRITQLIGAFQFEEIRYLRLSDLNHDSHLDLFVGQSFASAVVLAGRGDGSFSNPVPVTPDGSLRSGAVAEVTGDGNEDIVGISVDTIRTYAGVGDGTFVLAVTTPVTSPGATLLLDDFNGDGLADLLTTKDCYSGAGGGSFSPPHSYGDPNLARAAPADFNGDGKLDFAATNRVRSLYRFDGNGDGTFGTWRHETTAGTTSRPALGDFNGDGHPDASVAIDRGTSLSGLVEVRLGHADGTYDPAVSYAAGLGASAIVAADFDGDGRLDLATSNPRESAAPNRISILRGVGDGTFLPPQNYSAGIFATELRAADLNGDGRPDLLATTGNGGSISSVHLNSGTGTFPGTGAQLAGAGHPPAIGDVDGDGHPDLVLLDATLKNANYYRNLGNGTFAARVTSTLPGSPVGVALGDFDEDGHPDLAVLNATTPATGIPYAVSLHLASGGGTFTQVGLSPVGGEPRDLDVADFDGDGHLDVATAAYTARAATVLTGDGFGGLPGRDDFGTGGRATALVARDLNGDGRTDLLSTTDLPDGFTILRQPPAISAAPEPLAPGLALLPAYPNPMTGATTIPFSLAQAGPVRVQIFDVSGRLVARLADRRFEAGAHALHWNGITDGGASAPSGLYFYALEYAGQRVARTLTLIH